MRTKLVWLQVELQVDETLSSDEITERAFQRLQGGGFNVEEVRASRIDED